MKLKKFGKINPQKISDNPVINEAGAYFEELLTREENLLKELKEYESALKKKDQLAILMLRRDIMELHQFIQTNLDSNAWFQESEEEQSIVADIRKHIRENDMAFAKSNSNEAIRAAYQVQNEYKDLRAYANEPVKDARDGRRKATLTTLLDQLDEMEPNEKLKELDKVIAGKEDDYAFLHEHHFISSKGGQETKAIKLVRNLRDATAMTTTLRERSATESPKPLSRRARASTFVSSQVGKMRSKSELPKREQTLGQIATTSENVPLKADAQISSDTTTRKRSVTAIIKNKLGTVTQRLRSSTQKSETLMTIEGIRKNKSLENLKVKSEEIVEINEKLSTQLAELKSLTHQLDKLRSRPQDLIVEDEIKKQRKKCLDQIDMQLGKLEEMGFISYMESVSKLRSQVDASNQSSIVIINEQVANLEKEVFGKPYFSQPIFAKIEDAKTYLPKDRIAKPVKIEIEFEAGRDYFKEMANEIAGKAEEAKKAKKAEEAKAVEVKDVTEGENAEKTDSGGANHPSGRRT